MNGMRVGMLQDAQQENVGKLARQNRKLEEQVVKLQRELEVFIGCRVSFSVLIELSLTCGCFSSDSFAAKDQDGGRAEAAAGFGR